MSDGTPNASPPAHEVVAVVLQVRDARLQVLLWQRARSPQSGRWALPGGGLEPSETLGASVARHLAAKVDVREVAHLEQIETRSDPGRVPGRRTLATAYLGLVATDLDPRLPPDTAWHPVDALPPLAFDHGSITRSGRDRLRAKLSYTNIGFALAAQTFTIAELRVVIQAALGYPVSATNLQRILLRRRLLVPTGQRLAQGPAGGRPAAVYRFAERTLRVTDEFAVLRPPVPRAAGRARQVPTGAAATGGDTRSP